jgi:hypothetical protein
VSVLTKIFVVLLVVLSLVLSAATITFVAKTDDFSKANTELKTSLDTANAKASEAERLRSELNASLTSQLAQATSERDAARTSQKQDTLALAQAKADLAARDGQIALLTSVKDNDSKVLAGIAARNEATQKRVTELEQQNLKLTSELGEANRSLATAQQRETFATASSREANEKLVELKAIVDRLSGALRDRGVNPESVTGGVAAGAPAINGVVSAKLDIGGVPYAKISVGSDDAVSVGMTFNVVDRASGNFLGKLTIRQVNPNEAIGSLEGPGVGDIRAGNEVRTPNS